MVILFGKNNAPFTYVAYMNEVLAKHTGKHALVYLEDIIIYSPTKVQHNEDLWSVLNTLLYNWLLAKLLKRMFYQQEFPFLRHIMSAKGINTNLKGVEATRQLLYPWNNSKIHTFLGMVA